MRGRTCAVRRVLLALALLAAAAVAACGSGSSSDSTGASTSSAAPATGPGEGVDGRGTGGAGSDSDSKPGSGGGKDGGAGGASGSAGAPGDTSSSFQPRPHSDSGGGAEQFETKGGDNSIQEFGGETSSGDFAQAAATVHNYLDARAAGAWNAACEYLAAGVAEQLTQLSGGGSGSEAKQPSCAEVLAGLSAGIPDRALREAAVADVGALRTEGDSGFLLFKGAHGARYFVPMAREDGAWKVAAIAPSAFG